MTGKYSAYETEIRDQALAGCPKSLRSLLPYSYLPLVSGRGLRKEAIFYAGCYCDRSTTK